MTTEKTQGAQLEELQKIDEGIAAVEERIGSYGPLLEEVEEPALALEDEVNTTRSRLQEMKVDERRLELTAQEKRNRVKKLQERLDNVRNVREQAAVSAELDLVKKALDGDEQEALTLLDQIRKLELRLDEQKEALEQARSDVEPRRVQLLQEREDAERELEDLRSRREAFAGSMESRELRAYESIRRGSGRRAVSRLTPDGACGHCFSVIPLQLQNEIRHGSEMIRCEACGVILAAAESDAGEDAQG